MNMKKFLKIIWRKDIWKSRAGLAVASSFAVLLWFDIVWCMSTTFRAMSDWLMWVNTVAASLVLALPYALTRRMWVQIVFLAITGCLLEANLMYCRTYFAAIPPESYLLAGNLSDFTASIGDSLRWADLGLPLILIAAAVIAHRRVTSPGPFKQWLYITCCAAAFSIAGIFGVMARGGFYREYDRLVQSCYYTTCGVPTYTVAGHIAYNIIDSRHSASPQARGEVERWLSEHSRMMPLYELPDSIVRRRSLILILCESLESWTVGAKVGNTEITPYLNSLIEDSTTYYAPNILTQVASGRSIDCQLMINAGLLPMIGTVYSMKYPDAEYPTINKAMSEIYGATSQIYTADNPVTWNQDAIRRSFGYDSLFDRRAWHNDELIGRPAKLSDGSFLRQAAERLKQSWPVGEPRMVTFVTYSGHNPFILPDDKKDPALDVKSTDLPQRVRDYVEMAHYTDSQLHRLVDYVRSRPDYDSMLVVITGDHEGLGTTRGEARDVSSDARRLVSSGQYTPLIILNSPVAGRDDRVGGQVDIYPTLLSLLGLERYGWHGVGRNLLDPGRETVAVSSMTSEIAGDTVTLDSETLRHLKEARRISDAAIRCNFFDSNSDD